MIGWLHKRKNSKRFVDEPAAFAKVSSNLAEFYREKLKPLESDFHFRNFHSPPIADGDFTAKPMVLVMGQYSTGKSSFIRHLLQRDYPGIRVSPEPTTDKFICVMGGPNDQIIPGNALVTDPQLPFTQIAYDMCESFFGRFQASVCSSPVLDGISFIDSPGILSGEKQRNDRGYDYEKATRWFAGRVDMIILVFDAHSLDISDEFRRVIGEMKGNTHKIRIVLNKADSVDALELLRVYGALTWSLAKALGTPEAPRIYIGSFWDKPIEHNELQRVFETDTNDLFSEIANLPKNGALRQVDDLIKRARLVRVHACVLAYLRSKIYRGMGRKGKQNKLVGRMAEVFQEVGTKYEIPRGDFPDVKVFTHGPLAGYDLFSMPKVSDKSLALMLSRVDDLLTKDIPRMMQLLPIESMGEKEAVLPVVAVAETSPRKHDSKRSRRSKRRSWESKSADDEFRQIG